MKRSRHAGFTLIELLIVVAIIGILAAVAVPNFLNARTRAQVMRAVADMRNVSVAFGSYAADHGDFPLGVIMGHTPRERWSWGFLPEILSTPVAYLADLPIDEFNFNYKIYGQNQGLEVPIGHPHSRYRTTRKKPYMGADAAVSPEDHKAGWKRMLADANIDGTYLLVSPGPDGVEDILPAYNPHTYASSNGLRSAGDIVVSDGGAVGF